MFSICEYAYKCTLYNSATLPEAFQKYILNEDRSNFYHYYENIWLCGLDWEEFCNWINLQFCSLKLIFP